MGCRQADAAEQPASRSTGERYAATKAEVVILTRRFAMELGSHGITVNAVAPGFVRTDMTLRGRGATDWQATEERFAARAMMGRVGEPQDVASAVVFLASPQSGWITAQTLTVARGVDGLHRTRLGSGAHLRRHARLRLSEQNCSDAQTTG